MELFEGRVGGGGGGVGAKTMFRNRENVIFYYYFGEQGNKQVYFRGTRDHVPPWRASTILYMF